MAGVLTMGSKVTCEHEGAVGVSSTEKLKVSNYPVLVKASIAGKSIAANCTTTDALDDQGKQKDKKCTSVSSVLTGEATKLKVNNQPVMLDTLSGTTDGIVNYKPQPSLKATVGQTKLTAI